MNINYDIYYLNFNYNKNIKIDEISKNISFGTICFFVIIHI